METSPTPPPPADHAELDRLKLLANQAKANFGLILLADRKAVFLLRTALGLLGIAFIALPPALFKLKELFRVDDHPIAFAIALFVIGVSAGCLLYAVSHLVRAVRPRLNQHDFAHSDLFFGAVAQQTPEQFRDFVNGMTNQQAVDDLIAQVYNSAQIAQAKYASLDRATIWMLTGGSVGVTFAVCVLVSYGVMA